MATVQGAINTLTGAVYGTAVQAGVGGPANWVTGGFIDGRVKVMLDYYLCVAVASGTVIKMGNLLPLGAKVIAVIVQTNVSTGSLTWSVGDLETATRYASASSNAATAGTYVYGGGVSSTVGPYVIGTTTTPTSTSNDQQIIITTGGATSGTQVITCAVLYTTN